MIALVDREVGIAYEGVLGESIDGSWGKMV